MSYLHAELGRILATACDDLRAAQDYLRQLEGKEPDPGQYSTAVIGRAMHKTGDLYTAEIERLRAELAARENQTPVGHMYRYSDGYVSPTYDYRNGEYPVASFPVYTKEPKP